MRGALNILSWLLILAYPLIVFFGLHVVPVAYLGVFLVILAAARLCLAPPMARGWVLSMVIPSIVILAGLHAFLTESERGLLFYPAIVNAVLLCVFGASMLQKQTFVERLARLRDPDLSPAAVAYTRAVTGAWCLFFAANAAAALYTAMYTSLEVWALYNGLLAYLLMGAMFAGEWLVRRKVMRSGGVQAG
jgi:uncharacterized membrane protein